MKILAIADVEDNSLEELIKNDSQKLKSLDCIVSCGDLQRKYIEYVSDSIKKPLLFVSGNHFTQQFYEDLFKSSKEEKKIYNGKGSGLVFGGVDLHARVEIFKDYIFVGFGGSIRYNPGKFQFEEHEMAKLVNRCIRKIKMIKIIDFFTMKKPKKIIVVSHAPIKDIHDKNDNCHKGFKCFRKFIDEINPLLWLHGHVHHEGQIQRQLTVLHKTTIVNVIPSKIIEIKKKDKVFVRQIFA